jgi:hypothetical protein
MPVQEGMQGAVATVELTRRRREVGADDRARLADLLHHDVFRVFRARHLEVVELALGEAEGPARQGRVRMPVVIPHDPARVIRPRGDGVELPFLPEAHERPLVTLRLGPADRQQH